MRSFSHKISSFFSEIWLITPMPIKRIFDNRLVLLILSLGIGGIIGNRFDNLYVERLFPWFIGKSSYPNIFILLGLVLFIFFLWLLICCVRLVDARDKYRERVDKLEADMAVSAKETMGLVSEIATLNERVSFNKNSGVVRETADEFYQELSNMVTNASVNNDLMISIGEGESLKDWLIRIYGEARAGRVPTAPKISTIRIKTLSEEFCDVLIKAGVLHPSFKTHMQRNIDELQQDDNLKYYNVPIVITRWDRLPPYHGFIYNKRFLINNWQVSPDGFLHVRTSLIDYNADEHASLYNDTIKSFYYGR